MAAHHVEVGAHAGDRRAQLVAGVLHEPLLLLRASGPARRACDRRRRSAGRPRRRRRCRPIASSRPVVLDVLGGRRQAAQRCRSRCWRSTLRPRRRSPATISDSATMRTRRLRSTRSVSSSDRATWNAPRGHADRSHPIVVAVDRDRVEGVGAGPPGDRLGRRRRDRRSTNALVERRLDHRSVRQRPVAPRSRRTGRGRRTGRTPTDRARAAG